MFGFVSRYIYVLYICINICIRTHILVHIVEELVFVCTVYIQIRIIESFIYQLQQANSHRRLALGPQHTHTHTSTSHLSSLRLLAGVTVSGSRAIHHHLGWSISTVSSAGAGGVLFDTAPGPGLCGWLVRRRMFALSLSLFRLAGVLILHYGHRKSAA